jgi:murein DD-endopeptidase MepM/ murein hydrolase activator NlpD
MPFERGVKGDKDYVYVKVADNPGFAPLAHHRDLEPFESSGEFYAGLTGIFNQDYIGVVGSRKKDYNYYYHEGIDFAGLDGGMPIKSFIYGKVLQAGIHNMDSSGKGRGMGRYIVAQNSSELTFRGQNLYYVLVHIKDLRVETGDKLYPGMDVGTVGRDDRGESGCHLHISHVLADSLGEIVHPTGSNFGFWGFHVKEGDSQSRKVLNPFDHSDKPWKGRDRKF